MRHSRTVYEGGPTPLEPLLDLRGTARTLSVSERTIYRLVSEGELQPVRVRRRLRFEPSELRRYLERGSH